MVRYHMTLRPYLVFCIILLPCVTGSAEKAVLTKSAVPSNENSLSDSGHPVAKRSRDALRTYKINKCVNPKNSVKRLSAKCLSDIMTKYKKDVCDDDFDRAMLCTDDIEPFIRYKYPILRLWSLTEERDHSKKIYIMTSMLLYHCCVKSQTGMVDGDLVKKMSNYEQELILKFCERLSEVETTINNVEWAICDSFESTRQLKIPSEESTIIPNNSNSSTTKSSISTIPSEHTSLLNDSVAKTAAIKFNSSITVLPSVIADASTFSNYESDSEDNVVQKDVYVDSDEFDILYNVVNKVTNKSSEQTVKNEDRVKRDKAKVEEDESKDETDSEKEDTAKRKAFAVETGSNFDERPYKSFNFRIPKCTSNCSCATSRTAAPSGDCSKNTGTCVSKTCKKKLVPTGPSKFFIFRRTKKTYIIITSVFFALLLLVFLSTIPLWIKSTDNDSKLKDIFKLIDARTNVEDIWECQNNLCQRVYKLTNKETHPSHSRCILLCSGPQIWPLPIGDTQYSKDIINLATSKLEYKLKTVPSDELNQYLAEAFKLFIGHMAKLEHTGRKQKKHFQNMNVTKMSIRIEVESDPDPRLRLNTEESYRLSVETDGNLVYMKISSPSFCGVRHGLETLKQMILFDQSTGYLITLSKAAIKDAPSFKYRGLMIETGRNYVPVTDLMRTVDAMATVKLNTFHWRISDATSFPLVLDKTPQLFEHGAYDRSLVYTKDDVRAIVKRAGVKGVRVLIEVAAPGPVGRPWSWLPEASCSAKGNQSCDNLLCLRLGMQDAAMSVLQTIYQEILEMTQVDDIFHLSNGLFSLANCQKLIEDRAGFLDKALDILKLANKGFLPKLPIIWYTPSLAEEFEARSWERYGVQLSERLTNPSDNFLSKYKVIHSSKWILSCEMTNNRCWKYRTWQEMYSWKSWRNVEVFTVEGGEAILWTDLVNSGNLDNHIWPRTAAVAERLWSDIVANSSPTGHDYLRLDRQRSRMLLDGVKVPPIWPAWCTYNPGPCLEKVQKRNNNLFFIQRLF